MALTRINVCSKHVKLGEYLGEAKSYAPDICQIIECWGKSTKHIVVELKEK